MSRLSEDTRRKLIYKFDDLTANGANPTGYSLWRWAKTQPGLKLLGLSKAPSRNTITNIIRKWEAEPHQNVNAAVKDKRRSQANRRGVISEETRKAVIAQALDEDQPRYLRRAVGIAKKMKISHTAVRNILKSDERTAIYLRPRSSPQLTDHHKEMRLRAGLRYIRYPKSIFQHIGFSDESSFKQFATVNPQNDGTWAPRKSQRTAKHEKQRIRTRERSAVSRNVWGAVCSNGKSQLVVFSGKMDADFYLKDILTNYAIPFIIDPHNEIELFLQDHDPKHTATPVVEYLNATIGPDHWTQAPPTPCKVLDEIGRIIRVPKPDKNGKIAHRSVDNKREDCKCELPRGKYSHMTRSPDLNIMEDVWAWMENERANHPVPQSARQLELLLFKLWDALPMEFVRRMVDSMPKRLAEVVRMQGEITHYH
jgi:hypothetical protein